MENHVLVLGVRFLGNGRKYGNNMTAFYFTLTTPCQDFSWANLHVNQHLICSLFFVMYFLQVTRIILRKFRKFSKISELFSVIFIFLLFAFFLFIFSSIFSLSKVLFYISMDFYCILESQL